MLEYVAYAADTFVVIHDKHDKASTPPLDIINSHYRMVDVSRLYMEFNGRSTLSAIVWLLQWRLLIQVWVFLVNPFGGGISGMQLVHVAPYPHHYKYAIHAI